MLTILCIAIIVLAIIQALILFWVRADFSDHNRLSYVSLIIVIIAFALMIVGFLIVTGII